jgi:hypothetical protein
VKPSQARNFIFFILCGMAIAALMIPGAIVSIDTRSAYALWESGHLFLFLVATHLLCVVYPPLLKRTFVAQLGSFLGGAILCALAVEGLQSVISGKAIELTDVIGDLTGTVLFLSFHYRRQAKRYVFLHGSALLLAGFALWPVVWSFSDEMLTRSQFPLLADFETPFEKSRFEGETGSGALTTEQAFYGRRSLRLALLPGPWSGMTMKYFPSDWRGYSAFHFAVYNPGADSVSLEVSIQDAAYRHGNKPFSDCFSQKIDLPAGCWTRVQIPLAEVQKGGQTREMDLAHITGLGFFVEKEKNPLTLYLDTIGLE